MDEDGSMHASVADSVIQTFIDAIERVIPSNDRRLDDDASFSTQQTRRRRFRATARVAARRAPQLKLLLQIRNLLKRPCCQVFPPMQALLTCLRSGDALRFFETAKKTDHRLVKASHLQLRLTNYILFWRRQRARVHHISSQRIEHLS
jgi:hypothetical protein